MKSEKRLKKLYDVLQSRQNDATIVLEDIHDPHNASAIFRTADAVGISEVQLVYKTEKFPRIGSKSSSSANKWIEKRKHKSIESCYEFLRENNYKIYATALVEESTNYFDFDFTKPTAFVLGNEHRGVSDEALKNADEVIKIPMMGMIQSLNVSVAAAILFYEMLRQRFLKNEYQKSKLSIEEFNNKFNEWKRK
ncbi:MAG: RNA methyltransferase [Bacteroidota bacterium]